MEIFFPTAHQCGKNFDKKIEKNLIWEIVDYILLEVLI